MKFTKQLRMLVSQDRTVQEIPELLLTGKYTDQNHVQRRMQQRAINFDMMKLAIAYGEVEFHSKAKTWTLLDKCLENPPYCYFAEKLRGLRLIALPKLQDEIIYVTTVYWSYSLRY